MLKPVGVFAVTTIFGPPTGLNVGRFPGLGPDGAQERCRVAGASANFHVEWLKQSTALLVPVVLKRQDNLLESAHIGLWLGTL